MDLEVALPQVFRALVHVDASGKEARQRASRDELMTAPAPVPQLIERLTGGRLLLAEEAGGRAVVTLAHEALILTTTAEPRDRLYAVEALGAIRPVTPEIVPTLAAALRDADAAVRRAAVKALREIGPAAEQALTAVVENANAGATARRTAAKALEQISSISRWHARR